jgi:hypothetical protein
MIDRANKKLCPQMRDADDEPEWIRWTRLSELLTGKAAVARPNRAIIGSFKT